MSLDDIFWLFGTIQASLDGENGFESFSESLGESWDGAKIKN